MEIERIAKIAAALYESDRELIKNAVLADCHEYWLTEPLSGFGMEMGLAGSDLVLSPDGLAVRRYLKDQSHDQ